MSTPIYDLADWPIAEVRSVGRVDVPPELQHSIDPYSRRCKHCGGMHRDLAAAGSVLCPLAPATMQRQRRDNADAVNVVFELPDSSKPQGYIREDAAGAAYRAGLISSRDYAKALGFADYTRARDALDEDGRLATPIAAPPPAPPPVPAPAAKPSGRRQVILDPLFED